MNIIDVLRSHCIGVGKKLVGTAQPEDVLLGETFSNADGNDKVGTLQLTGDATASEVLLNATFYNTDAKTQDVGTMPNNGSVGTQNLTTQNAEYTIPAGYHNGLGKVKALITNLIASVIKAGVTVGGILGTFTSDANAAAAQILTGYSGYVNGIKISGSMVNNGANNIQGQLLSDVTISAGYYNGSGKVLKPTQTAGDTNQYTFNGTSYQFGGTTYVEKFRIVSILAGTLRISFKLDETQGIANTYGQIYKNGVAVGTERMIANKNPATFTEDISGIAVGDIISIYCKRSNTEVYSLCTNFKITFA